MGTVPISSALQLHELEARARAALDRHLRLAQSEMRGDERDHRGVRLAIDGRRLHAREPGTVVLLGETVLTGARLHLESERAHRRDIMRQAWIKAYGMLSPTSRESDARIRTA